MLSNRTSTTTSTVPKEPIIVGAQDVDEKIRIRTEEELALQARGLCEMRDIFNGLGIPYFISGGTLLGIIRERDFIKWDWDVGIDARVEDIIPKEEEFIEMLKKNGFEVVAHYPEQTNYKINAIKYGARYEIAGLILVGNKRYRRAYNYPDEYVQGNSEIVLRGETYTTFPFPEKYLEWLYGDWRTPIRTVDKSAYVTASSRTSPFSRIITKLVSLFR